MGQASKKAKRLSMAKQADRHILYEKAVQCVEAEIDFVDETFETLRGRKADLLREDFCGTMNTSCEWVRRRETNTAIGVDLDAEVLNWGREHNVGALPRETAMRLTSMEANVLEVETPPVDILLAMNFSYFCFKQRDLLRSYFEKAHAALKDDGVMFMDAFGGFEAFSEMEEPRKCEGFTYVWDQDHYDPITGDMTCHIHFTFRDGSRMDKAFTYEWRLWTLPEIKEILLEAGFADATVYWDFTEDGDGEYEPAEHGEADAGWICYIVAQK